jgi:hypothetical protein
LHDTSLKENLHFSCGEIAKNPGKQCPSITDILLCHGLLLKDENSNRIAEHREHNAGDNNLKRQADWRIDL